jgi:serine acetyltransferase
MYMDKSDKKKKEQKKGARPKIPLRTIFRLVVMSKFIHFLPYPWLLIAGCLVGLGGYYSLSSLYDASHLLFAVFVGPIILAFIFLFELLLSLGYSLRVKMLLRGEAMFGSGEDYERDFAGKHSLMYSFTLKLVYQGWAWKGFSHLLPLSWLVPFIRLVGAKIGKNVNVIGPGTILDPELTEIGDNTTIGDDAIITGHLNDGGGQIPRFVLKKVVIGKNCLIGARSIIMPGVVVGDNAIVAAGAMVVKDTKILPNSVWAGIPARMIKQGPVEQQVAQEGPVENKG